MIIVLVTLAVLELEILSVNFEVGLIFAGAAVVGMGLGWGLAQLEQHIRARSKS